VGENRRQLFIDEDLSPRIAGDLRHRGRANAKSIARTAYKGMKDAELLRALARDYPEAVLVTGDDHMPAEHKRVLAETRITLAVIDPQHPPEYGENEWDFEVAQRWAHKMEQQAKGSVVRYTLAGGRTWTLRRRPGRLRGVRAI